jgi:hypothetical protein
VPLIFNALNSWEWKMKKHLTVLGSFFLLSATISAHSAVLEYGDEDVLGIGTYASDPKAGATLQGLALGVVTESTLFTPHDYPFAPSAGEFPGTDQIYVGSGQTGQEDGYSGTTQRIFGPQNLTMNYSSAVPAGQQVTSLTLGIAADDFQFPLYGQPFIANVNGISDPALVTELESVDESGPVVHFFTIGIDPKILQSNHTLTLTIDEGGNGGDGWAVDFTTVGVTTAAVPEPASLALTAMAGCLLVRRRQRRI